MEKTGKDKELKSRTEIFLNFMLRAVFGMIAIFLINSFLRDRGFSGSVGINPLSFATTGILGIPGVALLYGISFYFG